jgi:hypothetical protein
MPTVSNERDLRSESRRGSWPLLDRPPERAAIRMAIARSNFLAVIPADPGLVLV